MKDTRRPAVILSLAWLASIALAIVLTGCRRFSLSYAVFLVVSLALLAAGLLFLNAIWRKGDASLLFPFKKLIGYAVAGWYVAHSLPRVEWTNAGLIGNGRAAFIYALTLLGTALGLAAFFMLGRRPVLLAFGAITEEEARDAKLFAQKKRARIHGFVRVTLDWVDSLASAVIIVLLIEIFVFQLYAVPSESMVPVFLSGDRPFTLKVLEGPRLPLTGWRLPIIREPQRGDVVTIANPRYPENHEINLRKTLSQFLYMVTVTLVNIDREPDGTPKADPLVKRIVGVPGEKLMMVDDVLYARTASQPEFHPLETDRARYAQVDLWKLPPAVRARVQVIPLDENGRAILDSWDRKKNGVDSFAMAASLADRWQRLDGRIAGLARRALPAVPQALTDLFTAARAYAPGGENNSLSQKGPAVEDLSLLYAAVVSATTRATLSEYFIAGNRAGAGPTLYERGSRALNLLIKDNLLSRMERDAALLSEGASMDAVAQDPVRARLTQETRELYVYLTGYYDARNFPEFPAGKAFLGPDQYFAMGDNRYNSLDFRFSTDRTMRVLDPADPASVSYPSTLDPFPLEKRFIEGWAVFRLWPPARIGVIR